MKKPKLKNLAALTALALLAGGVEQTHAIPGNHWTLVGPSATGGSIIIGSGTVDLGPLGSSTLPVFLSPNGGNVITLDAGSTATSAGSEVIDLEVPSNTLGNYGTITDTGTSGYGVLVNSNGNTINNWGSINGHYGIVIYGQSNILNNWGQINSSSSYNAVFIDGNFDTVNNWGTFAGGNYVVTAYGENNTINNWGNFTNTGDYTVYIDGTNIVVNNHGAISAPYDPVWEADGSHNTINNWGTITTSGDYGIYTDGSYFTINNWGTLSSGSLDAVYSDGGHLTVNNWGNISSGGDGIDLYTDSNVINNRGRITSTAGDVVYLQSSNNTINNWGSMMSPEDAIYVQGVDTYTNNVVNNWGSITSTGATGVFLDTQDTLNNWGSISGDTYGVELYYSHDTVTNYLGGMIAGKTYAVYFDDYNQTLINWGTLSTPSAGSGVVHDGGYAGNIINNHGYIYGNGAAAITFGNTSDDTVNLLGHSVVVGKISISGINNVVNFNLTGLSPAKIAALNAVLAPQGVNSGNVTNSVVFALNGVNYNIDPAIVNFHATSYQTQALNSSEAAIGASLDSLNSIPTLGQMALFNAIDASGNIPGALDALSPIKYALYGDLAIQNTTAMVQNVDSRLNNLRDGSESVDTTGVGGDNTVATLATGYAKDGDSSKESKQVVPPEPKENRWGFFATGDGLFFRGSSHDAGLQDGKSNSAGTLAGIDGKVGENGVIGALFSYNNSAVDLGTDGSHATIESYTGGIYGSYHQDGFYANGLAAYTRNNYSSDRNILFPGFSSTAAGSTHGNQYSANIDGGYDWNVTNRLTVGPIAGVQYVHLDVSGFNETGAAGLALSDQNLNSLQSRVGGRIDYHLLTQANSSAALELYAAWQHEYLDDSRGISATFEGGGLTPFAVQTGSPQRDAAVVGATVNFTFHNRLTLFADYELQLWSESYFEQSINGGAKISW